MWSHSGAYVDDEVLSYIKIHEYLKTYTIVIAFYQKFNFTFAFTCFESLFCFTNVSFACTDI